jgi:TPR repeat protein
MDKNMKKILLAVILAISPAAFAESPYEFEKERGKSVQNINQEIQRSGGLERLISDANVNDANSMYVLSQMYQYGIVKEQDLDIAHNLLEKASEEKHAMASFRLGKIMLGIDDVFGKESEYINKRRGIHLISQSAEEQNPESQYILGLEYIKGEILPEDRDLGLFWLTKSRDRGYNKAAIARADLLNNSKMKNLSFDYIQKRAIEGNPDFLIKLASFYEDGWVVQKDREKAKRLLETAKRLGSKRAANILMH